MPRLVTRDGKFVEVPLDQLQEALRSGQFGVERDSPLLNVVTQAGRTIRTPDAGALLEALDAGARLETPEEAETRQVKQEFGGRNLEAALLGGLRSATLGVSDFVLTETGAYDPETIRKIAEGNPGLTFGSEILGSFAPGIGIAKGLSLAARTLRGANVVDDGAKLVGLASKTTGTGKANTLRKLVNKPDAFKAAEWATLGAAEGSAVGLQEGITEEVLGDPDVASETLLSHVADGAFTGLIFGGAVGLGSIGVGTLSKKLSKVSKKAERAIDQKTGQALGAEVGRFGLGPQASFEAVGLTKKQMNKLRASRRTKGDEWVKGAVETLNKPGLLPDPNDTAPIIPTKRGIIATTPDVQARAVEAADNIGAKIGGFVDDVDDIAFKSQTTEKVSVPHWADPDEWVEYTVVKNDFPDPQKVVRKIDGKIGELKDQSVVHKEAIQYLRDEKDQLRRLGDTPLPGEAGGSAWTFKAAQRFRRGLSQAYSPGMDTPVKDARQFVERAIAEEIEDAVERVLKKVGKENQFKEFKELKRAFSHLKPILDETGITNNLEGFLGFLAEAGRGAGIRASLGQDPVRAAGISALFAGVRRLTGLGGGTGVAPVQRAVISRTALGEKISGIRILQQAQEETVKRSEGAVSRFMRRVKGEEGVGAFTIGSIGIIEKMTGEKDSKEARKKFVENVRQVAADPEEASNRIAANIVHVEEFAPNTAAHMAQRMAFGLKQLEALLPTLAKSIQPQLQDFEQIDFTAVEEATQALTDPMGVIEAFAAGVPPSIVELGILQSVYGQLWQAVVEHMGHELANSDKAISYENMLAFARFSSQVFDWSLDPEAIARAQEFYQDRGPSSGQGPGGVRLTGLNALQGAMQGAQSKIGQLTSGQLGTK